MTLAYLRFFWKSFTQVLRKSGGGKLGVNVGKWVGILCGVMKIPRPIPYSFSENAQVFPLEHKHFYAGRKPKSDFYSVSTGLIMITTNIWYIYN